MNNAVEPTIRKVEGYIEGFFWVLPNLALALVVFLLFWGGATLAKRAVIGVAQRRDRSNLGTLLGGFVKWAVIVLGLLVVATIVFPSVKPADVLATLGIGSVAIGFAFKDILQNWLSGLLILYRQPFRTGDQIKSGEFEGTVERVEARATLIKTYDGQRVVIPNADIYTRAVTVRTAFPKRRSEYDVGIGYGDDVEEACRVIVEAMGKVEGVEREPAPEAFAWALDASSVNIKVRWWSDSHRANVVHVQGRAIAAIKDALSEAGIDLPFPTRVVLLHDQTEESDGDRTRQREGWPAGDRPPRPRHLNEVEFRRSASTGATDERDAASNDGNGRERVGAATKGGERRRGPLGDRGKDTT
jgi:small conductance mechanosensitive channel